MMDALIAGRVHGQPTARTGKNGKPFAVARVRAAGGDGESLFVTVIAFDEAPCKALLALSDGDSVALSGSLTPKVWTDKEGNTRPALDLGADLVPRHPQARCCAARPGFEAGRSAARARGRASSSPFFVLVVGVVVRAVRRLLLALRQGVQLEAAAAAVLEEVAQADRDRAERDAVPGDLVLAQQRHKLVRASLVVIDELVVGKAVDQFFHCSY